PGRTRRTRGCAAGHPRHRHGARGRRRGVAAVVAAVRRYRRGLRLAVRAGQQFRRALCRRPWLGWLRRLGRGRWIRRWRRRRWRWWRWWLRRWRLGRRWWHERGRWRLRKLVRTD